MDSLTPFRIGDWRVDPVANTFEQRDESTSVEPKAMQVLEVLAERPGELVAKKELLDRVWEGRFVTDDVLTGAIGQLRRALGDDARSPTYIQTVPRRGYRLVAEVEALLPRSPDPSMPVGRFAERRDATTGRGSVMVVGLVVASLLVVGTTLIARNHVLDRDAKAERLVVIEVDEHTMRETPKRHPDALVAYQRARLQMKAGVDAGPGSIMDDLRHAVELDPDFAEAWVLLSCAHTASRHHGVPADIAVAEARRAARRALAVAPNSPQVQFRMAQLHLYYDRDMAAARLALDRAIALDPTHAEARRMSAGLYSIVGDFEAAVGETREAKRLDPANEPTGFQERLRFMAGEKDAAIDDLKELLEARPEAYFLRLVLVELLRAEGRDAEAWEATRVLYVQGDALDRLAVLQAAFEEGGFARMDRLLLDELLRDREQGIPPRRSMLVAEMASLAGDLDLAFSELDRLADEGDPEVLYLRARPIFDPLRGDPRYVELLQRLGIPFGSPSAFL